MGPYIKSNNKTSKIMIHLMIALIPIIIFSVYKNGYIPYSKGYVGFGGLLYPLFFILIGSLTSFLTETIYGLIFKNKDFIKNSYSIFPGLFLSLILPLNIPIIVLILGSFIASFVGKLIFGGFGKNVFNPALIGYIFIVASFPSLFTTNAYLNNYELDAISKATPLTNSSLVSGIGSYDELIKPYGSLSDFFIGTVPGSLGETSALLCVVAFVYLSIVGVIKWKIPITYISTVFIINFIISRLLGVGLYYPIFSILTGGLMFGSIFMATDPVTSPVTNVGQVLYGLFLGILTVLLRFTGVEGVATSILIMNMFVFTLDRIGAKSRFNLCNSLVSLFVSVVLIFVVGIYIASESRGESKDPDFEIISKELNGDITNYVVNQKGYGGNIKSSIDIKEGNIISFEVLNHHETANKYELIIDDNYIDKLINDSDVDTVSGATITSTALKKTVINVMEDYNE